MDGSVRVLHVDDEPDFASLTAEFLERMEDPFTVETATAVSEIRIERLPEQYDCVVSDYDMPETDGLEFLKAVRDEDPDLPFILYTGRGSEQIAAEAISAGVTDYIQKEPGSVQYTILANRVKNAVQARRDERQVARSHRAMNAAWDGIGTIDDEGRFTYLNDAYAETFGHDTDELLGRHWETVYSEESIEIVDDEILPAVRENGTWTGETKLVRADGTEFVGEHTVASLDNGGSVFVVRDRSDREELNRELRHERERFRLLVDAVEEYAMFVLDRDGFVQSWNRGAEAIKQYEESEVIGKHISLFHTDEQVEKGLPDRLLEEAAETGQATDQGVRVRKDGSTFWADETITTLYDRGDIRGFAKITKDITDKIERERRQARNERYRQRLYEITNDTDRTLKQRVVDVLGLGVEYLDVENGHLVVIDLESDRHKIIAVSGDYSVVGPDETSPLSETYCRRTIEENSLLSIYNAAEAGWTDDPAYQKYGIGCYLGAKLEVEGELFGTVCFVDRDPRSEAFPNDEKSFVEQITRWLIHELDRCGGADQLPLKS
ncbi:MAG: PAS domain S-box protein [Haloarcula sp.]